MDMYPSVEIDWSNVREPNTPESRNIDLTWRPRGLSKNPKWSYPNYIPTYKPTYNLTYLFLPMNLQVMLPTSLTLHLKYTTYPMYPTKRCIRSAAKPFNSRTVTSPRTPKPETFTKPRAPKPETLLTWNPKALNPTKPRAP